MADRTVENPGVEVPQMPEILERVLLYALDEGKQKMMDGEDVIPFTALVVKDSVFLAEGGVPGAPTGYAIGLLYTTDPTQGIIFNNNPSYIGEAPNFMDRLRDASEYAETEIEAKYQ